MECPRDHEQLEPLTLRSIRIDRCPGCHGMWFAAGEFRLLKDKQSHGDYCWINFDLWRDMDRFRAATPARYACPGDGSALTTVRYGGSSVRVDVCSRCRGLWLDHGEFQAIVAWLRTKVDSETVGAYLKDIREEFIELFTGQEGLRTGLRDLASVLYLLELRFAVQHPHLAAAADSLPR
jgi:Zn-finger nucleic acid-binding protein